MALTMLKPRLAASSGKGSGKTSKAGAAPRQPAHWQDGSPNQVQKRTRGHALSKLRERIFRASPLCAHCLTAGRYTPGAELDHVLPLSQGGTDADANLQVLCVECHRIKSAREAGKRPVMGCGADGFPRDASHHWRDDGGSTDVAVR